MTPGSRDEASLSSVGDFSFRNRPVSRVDFVIVLSLSPFLYFWKAEFSMQGVLNPRNALGNKQLLIYSNT